MYLYEKPLGFLDLSLYPWRFHRKQAFTSGNSANLSDTPLEITRPKTKTPGNSTSFLVDPLVGTLVGTLVPP